ncbi:MAG: hypothetical protein HC769_14825 [Cyanobacteria bacterium CRU_2_1]|nr:hypothetical protein [Cyanobacteria bacterium RU_5_0]NJR59995.1 hypothetical protein [Cyanobacteria bacterium CRU_2_1]
MKRFAPVNFLLILPSVGVDHRVCPYRRDCPDTTPSIAKKFTGGTILVDWTQLKTGDIDALTLAVFGLKSE